MLYIHQYPDWTKFRYDSKKILNALGQVRFTEGRLIGQSMVLENDDIEDDIIIRDLIASYAIDGKILTREIATECSSQKELSIVEAFQKHIIKQYNATITFEQVLLYEKKSNFNKKNELRYRIGEGIIYDKEGNTLFVGPRPERIQQEMTNYITWFNISQMDNIIKAAIAQFWFLTIRPYNESNGKIARSITNLLLVRANNTGKLYYSIYEQFLADKENYFNILSRAQAGNGDLTEWILWFLKALQNAILTSEKNISLKIKSIRFKNRKNAEKLSPRAKKIIDAIFTSAIPHPFNIKEVAAFTGTSHDSALRDIQKMIDLNLVIPSQKGGRSTKYSLNL